MLLSKKKKQNNIQEFPNEVFNKMKMFSLIVTNGHLLVIFFNFVANKRKRIFTLKTFQRFRIFPCDM